MSITEIRMFNSVFTSREIFLLYKYGWIPIRHWLYIPLYNLSLMIFGKEKRRWSMEKGKIREILEKYTLRYGCVHTPPKFMGECKHCKPIIDQAEAEIEKAVRVEELEKIARLARIFIIDARGSWDTQEGDYCLKLVDEYFEP